MTSLAELSLKGYCADYCVDIRREKITWKSINPNKLWRVQSMRRNIWPDGFMSRLLRGDRKLSGCLPVHTLRGNFLSIVTMATVTRGQKLLKDTFLKAYHHCFLRSVVRTLWNTGWMSKKLARESWSNLKGQYQMISIHFI